MLPAFCQGTHKWSRTPPTCIHWTNVYWVPIMCQVLHTQRKTVSNLTGNLNLAGPLRSEKWPGALGCAHPSGCLSSPFVSGSSGRTVWMGRHDTGVRWCC